MDLQIGNAGQQGGVREQGAAISSKTGQDTGEGLNSDQPGRRPKAKTLRPLARLLPMLLPYRFQIICASIFLTLAAVSTLVVPVAVRRVIDNGFSGENAAFVDQYFSVMMLVVAILAISSAGRYYFVTWIGERVVADLRDKVFVHLLRLVSVVLRYCPVG